MVERIKSPGFAAHSLQNNRAHNFSTARYEWGKLPENEEDLKRCVSDDSDVHYEGVVKYLSSLNDGVLSGNNNSSGVEQNTKLKIEKLTKLCLTLLTEKSTLSSERSKQRVLTIAVHAALLELNIDAKSDDPTTKQDAENKKFILQRNLEQAQKGLTKTININGEDIPYDPYEKETVLSWFLHLFGSSGSSAGFVQTCSNIKTNVAVDISVLICPMIMALSASFRELGSNLTAALNLLKGQTNMTENTSAAENTTNAILTIENAQKKIEALFNHLINEGITNDLKISYTSLLTNINQMTPEDIQKLATLPSKVKISKTGQSSKTYSYRNTLPGLLHLLNTLIDEENQDNSTNIDQSNNSNNKTQLQEIYRKCYFSDPSTNPGAVEIQNTTYSYADSYKYLDTLVSDTNWEDRIATYNSLNKALYVIEHTSPSDKKLLVESFMNRTQVIEDKLNLHRRKFDWKVITLTSIGVFISNIATIILPLEVDDIHWLIGGGILVAGIQSVGTGTFNAICNASYLGSEWRGVSTHGQSTNRTLSQIDKPQTENGQSLQSLENASDNDDTVAELIKGILNTDLQGLTKENLESRIATFCGTYRTIDRKTLIKTILEYNTSYKGEKNVPFIYQLYDKANANDKKEILKYYYENVLNTETAGENQSANMAKFFSECLAKTNSNLSEAALNLCKCLSTIAQCEQIGNTPDLENAQKQKFKNTAYAMAEELSRALINAKEDKNSNFHKLTQANHLRNFILRFISGTVAYAVSVALAPLMSGLTFGIGALPAAGLVLVVFTLKRLFDRRFAESYSTQILDDSLDFLKEHVPNSQENANSPTKSNQYWQPIELNAGNSVLANQLDFDTSKFMDQTNDVLNIEDYTLNLINQISNYSYDTQSLLSLLQHVTNKLNNGIELNLTLEQKRKAAGLLKLAIESPRFKNVLNDIRTDYMYQTIVGLVTALSWATYIAPIIRTSFKLSVGFIRIADLIVGSGIGFTEGLFTAPNCRQKFYETMGTEEKAYISAKSIIDDFIKQSNEQKIEEQARDQIQGNEQPTSSSTPGTSGSERMYLAAASPTSGTVTHSTLDQGHGSQQSSLLNPIKQSTTSSFVNRRNNSMITSYDSSPQTIGVLTNNTTQQSQNPSIKAFQQQQQQQQKEEQERIAALAQCNKNEETATKLQLETKGTTFNKHFRKKSKIAKLWESFLSFFSKLSITSA